MTIFSHSTANKAYITLTLARLTWHNKTHELLP